MNKKLMALMTEYTLRKEIAKLLVQNQFHAWRESECNGTFNFEK